MILGGTSCASNPKEIHRAAIAFFSGVSSPAPSKDQALLPKRNVPIEMIDLGYAIDAYNHFIDCCPSRLFIEFARFLFLAFQRVTRGRSMNLPHFGGQAVPLDGLDKVAAQKLFRRQEQ
jgi:hypothetical protein